MISIAAITFVFLSRTYYCDDILQYKYTPMKEAKFKKIDQKIKAFVACAFYCALVILCIYTTKVSYLWFLDPANYHTNNRYFANHLREAVIETVVFLGLWAYILLHKSGKF